MIQTSIRIYEDLYERALEWCKKNDRNFSYLVRKAVDAYLSSSESDS